MSSNIRNQAHDSFSLGPKAVSIRSEAIFELGKKLVEELGPDQSVDTLARWMAHYSAELIQAAEAANGEERQAKTAECASAILDLWEHRGRFPKGMRPFEELDPILRTLESLDLNADALRYYHSRIDLIDEKGEGAEARQWLNIAKRLDYSARALICYCLACAAESALDKSAEWVALAEAAGVDKGSEFPIVRFVASEMELLNADNPNDEERKMIEDRIARLEAFQAMSCEVVAHLRQRLDLRT
jgi:hypothetical protein